MPLGSATVNTRMGRFEVISVIAILIGLMGKPISLILYIRKLEHQVTLNILSDVLQETDVVSLGQLVEEVHLLCRNNDREYRDK